MFSKLLTYLSPFKWYLLAALLVVASLLAWEAKRIWDQSNDDVTARAALAQASKNCHDNAVFSEESSDALTNRLSSIDDYAGRLLQPTAVLQPAVPSGQSHATPVANKPAGCTVEQREANDHQAAQLISCQSTLCYIYKQNGQEDLLPAGRCSN